MRTELFLCCVFLAGFGLWFSGFLYSVEISVAALCLLALVYFPFGFYFFQVRGQQNLVFSVIAGSLLFMAPVSLLFNLLGFSNAKLQTGIGLCVIPTLLLVTIFLLRDSPSELKTFYTAHLVRITVWLLIILILYFVAPVQMPRF